jgi:hypothetical protein
MAGTVINLNDTTPAALSGRTNVEWLADSNNPRNVSASIATPAIANLSDVTLSALASGQLLSYNGTKWVNGSGPLTTAGDIIYENATPALARLPIGTPGQVLTVVGGLPAWATASVGVLTTAGDMVYENATPANARLPIGSGGQVLTVASGLPSWGPASAAAGDLYYVNATPALARLPIGTSGYVLTVVAGAPAWAAAGGGGGSSAPAGTAHLLTYNGSSTLGPGNNFGSQWSNLGGSFGVFNSGTNAGLPGIYQMTSGSGSYSQVAEDAVAKQICLNIFDTFRFYGAAASTSTSNALYWYGMSAVEAGSLAVTNPNNSVVAFRFLQGTDTHWMAYVGTATATFTAVSTGVVPDGNMHQWMIKQDSSGNLTFYIDGALVATINAGSTGIPTANTGMYPIVLNYVPSGTVQSYIHSIGWWSTF